MTIVSLFQEHQQVAKVEECGPGRSRKVGETVEPLAALIGSNELTCHFQPIVSLSKRQVFGYEALCRTKG
ncbi:MAG: hypothetical protein IH612_21495, partial [Desulfofustis sp.]|nr:hypothetical protein [Desulfofustis sp.]